MISSSSTAEATRGRAFGLEIEADFAIPGLSSAGGPGPGVVLRLASHADVARMWRPAEATRVSAEAPRAGDFDRTIDVHPELGYRIYARYFGLCVVSPDGGHMLCAPPPIPSWRWQRFLVGRCLPIAAMLRGYEVLHAGAVAVGDGVVAVTGPTGAGKTSLALHLTLAGARLFTDDVLTLGAATSRLLAYPGVGVLNVRTREHELLADSDREALGRPLGQTGRTKLHYVVPVAPGPLPLRSLYFLRPAAGRTSARLTPLPSPDPLRLMTSTFIHDVRRPEHLARLLDVCARLAADVPMFEIEMGTAEDAPALARRLIAHAGEAV